MLLKSVIDQSDLQYRAEIENIDKYFMRLNEPKIFNTQDSKSVLVEMDKAFEDVCFLLEYHGVINPKELSVFEFQRRLDLIESKKSKKKRNGIDPEQDFAK